jgi:hypothetical protein
MMKLLHNWVRNGSKNGTTQRQFDDDDDDDGDDMAHSDNQYLKRIYFIYL